MIYTGYWAQAKNYRKAGLKVISISQGHSKYFKPDGKIHQLCPTWEMVKRGYQESEYRKKILSKTSIDEILQEISTFTDEEYPDVVLLCFEKDAAECHRTMVKNWLNEHQIECKEYQFKRPGPIQVSMF